MTDQPAPDSTVEKPPETLSSILGGGDEQQQIAVAKAVIAELLQRRKLHQTFLHITCLDDQAKMSMTFSEDATYDQLLALLDEARNRIVDARYQAKLQSQMPEPPHEP